MRALFPLIRILFRRCVVSIMVLGIAMTVSVHAEADPLSPFPQTPPPLPEEYEVKTLSIEPHPDGKSYLGKFGFLNKTDKTIRLHGQSKPVGNKFIPLFPELQYSKDGAWENAGGFMCGTGAISYGLKPKTPYEFIVHLSDYEPQETPLTCRVGFEGRWSGSFVLDWKKDREEGKFIAARKAHDVLLRTAFTKAGFKPEKIAGDDFCGRLVAEMMAAVDPSHAPSFRPYVSKELVTPYIHLDGKISIGFRSDETRDYHREYDGWLTFDPPRFRPVSFRKSVLNKPHAEQSGSDLILFSLEDGQGFHNRFRLDIRYSSFDRSTPLPSQQEADAVFARMLGVLSEWVGE
jgi:hypothetical protein